MSFIKPVLVAAALGSVLLATACAGGTNASPAPTLTGQEVVEISGEICRTSNFGSNVTLGALNECIKFIITFKIFLNN